MLLGVAVAVAVAVGVVGVVAVVAVVQIVQVALVVQVVQVLQVVFTSEVGYRVLHQFPIMPYWMLMEDLTTER